MVIDEIKKIQALLHDSDKEMIAEVLRAVATEKKKEEDRKKQLEKPFKDALKDLDFSRLTALRELDAETRAAFIDRLEVDDPEGCPGVSVKRTYKHDVIDERALVSALIESGRLDCLMPRLDFIELGEQLPGLSMRTELSLIVRGVEK